MKYELFSFQSNNVTIQKKYKAEVSELHDALLQVKRDYDLLRMEFEQNLKANEQTGLIMLTDCILQKDNLR